MLFFLRANYVAPSTERVFLDEGWGIRDVRGPYIKSKFATLMIPAQFTSVDQGSLVTLVLAASNRSPEKFLNLRVSTDFYECEVKIERNKSLEVLIATDLLDKSKAEFCIKISIIDFLPDIDASRYHEIIALDEICIERFIETE